jgi:transposase
VAEVARRHDVSTALIYTWRSKVRQSVTEPGFAEAVVVAGELARGSRVSIFASAPPALAAAALKALR